MMNGSRIQRLEIEVLALQESMRRIDRVIETMMLAQLEHPDFTEQANTASSVVRAKAWRIAQQRKAIEQARDLQQQLRTLVQDNPGVGEFLEKEEAAK